MAHDIYVNYQDRKIVQDLKERINQGGVRDRTRRIYDDAINLILFKEPAEFVPCRDTTG